MTYLHLFQTIAQNVGTLLVIHNQRRNGEGANLNASWLRKAHNKPSSADKSCFPAFQSQILKTYARLFEEEWRTCNLRLKRRLNKSKYYPFELENIVKTAFVSMQSIFERDFLKIYTAFKRPTRGK